MPISAASDEVNRLESALRESEERFRATFEQAAVGLAHVTPEGGWLRVNHRLTEILGYSREELFARTLRDITHPDDIDNEAALTAQLVAGELPWFSIEKRYIRRDGSIVWVDRTVSMVSDATGQVKYLISVIQDATTRKMAQQRALAQSAVSRALIESPTKVEAMPRVLSVIGEMLDWQVGVYWTIDRDEDVLRVHSAWRSGDGALEQFETESRGIALKRGQGLPGRVWASGTPLWITDVASEPAMVREQLFHATALHAALAFPVRGPTESLGVMEFFSFAIRGADEALLHTVGGLGHQVGQFLERRRIENAISENEARRAAMMDVALDCIVTIDHTGVITEFNPAAERTFGYTREQAVGQSMSELIVPPSLREGHRKGMARYLATGEKHVLDQRIEITAMRADHSEFPIELAITQLPVAGPPVFMGSMRDLTERKRAEASRTFLLKASEVLASSLDYETTLRTVAELAVPAIADWCAVDMRTPMGTVERLAVMHSDPTKLQLVRDLQARYPSDPNSPRGVHQVLRTGVAEHIEDIPESLLREVARDAEHLKLIQQLGLRSYISVPLITRSGTIGVITLVNAESRRRFVEQDVMLATDLARRAATAIENSRLFHETLESQLRLEEQASELEAQAAELERAKSELEAANENLRVVNEELIQKTEEAEAARAVADEANKAKSAFLATMSHELRTPLNAIGGYAQLLEDGIRGPVTSEQRDDLRRIRRSQSHLTRLVNDVLNFAKLDMGRVQLKIEDVFVNEILGGVDTLIQPQISEKKLKYLCTPRAEDAITCADRERLMQILINLLTNAIKFTPAGGTISVDWDVVDEKVAIRVRDTGRGIPEDKIEQIFEPFLQLDRKLTREADGVGLGLAISRDLARAMRGNLTATSVPGEGSTFVLTLPLSTRKATPFRSMEAVPGQETQG